MRTLLHKDSDLEDDSLIVLEANVQNWSWRRTPYERQRFVLIAVVSFGAAAPASTALQ